MYRRGRWIRGTLLTLGSVPSEEGGVRVGLRTRKGLRGAVQRNRLKRQARVLLRRHGARLRHGLDLVIVLHPPGARSSLDALEAELQRIMVRAGVLKS